MSVETEENDTQKRGDIIEDDTIIYTENTEYQTKEEAVWGISVGQRQVQAQSTGVER